MLKYFEEKGSVDPQTGKSVNPDIVVANLTLKVLLDKFKTSNPGWKDLA